jgi:hypothetical protein
MAMVGPKFSHLAKDVADIVEKNISITDKFVNPKYFHHKNWAKMVGSMTAISVELNEALGKVSLDSQLPAATSNVDPVVAEAEDPPPLYDDLFIKM